MKKYLIIFSIIALVLVAVIIGIWINTPAEKPDDDYSSGDSAISRTAYFYVNSQEVDKITRFADFKVEKETFDEVEKKYIQNEISFYWLKNGEVFVPSDIEISETTNFFLILDTDIDLSYNEDEEKSESLKIYLSNICELEELTTVTIHMFDGKNEPHSMQVLASEFKDVSPIAIGGTRMFCLLNGTISFPVMSVFKSKNMFWQVSVEKADGTRIFSDVEKIENYPTVFSVIKAV